MRISKEYLVKAGLCNAEQAEKWASFLNVTAKRFDINTEQRIAGFLSQMSHESAGFTHVKESMNYSVSGLMNTFSRSRISQIDCERYGRIDGVQAANQPAIAECVYGGDWGAQNLGNTEEGDGAKFIGRGLIQLTGRYNYTQASEAVGEDYVESPESLEYPKDASLVSGWYWQSHGLNEVADTGNVEEMTRLINGGNNGLEQRQALYEQALDASDALGKHSINIEKVIIVMQARHAELAAEVEALKERVENCCGSTKLPWICRVLGCGSR